MATAISTQTFNRSSDPANSAILAKSIWEWTTTDIDRIYRMMSESLETAELRVVWQGNHTIEPVVRTVTAFAGALGVRLENYVAPFDQHFQEILDNDSGTFGHKPNLIVLWLSLRALAPTLVEGNRHVNTGEFKEEMERVRQTVADWIDLAKTRTRAHIFVCNFSRPPEMRFGIADASINTGEHVLYGRLNQWLTHDFADDTQVSVIDIAHAVSRAGSFQSWNPRMYRLGKIEWDGAAVKHIAELLARSSRALVRPARKCVVLDLDNTLWGGVLGEEGIQGIRIGEGDPTGEAFAAFQRALLDLKARGILLAICSKNNLEDVKEVFADRADMPLRLDDFAAWRINWDPKNSNIEAIAKELNIGLNSLVFIDDNPVECELILQMMPDVKTVNLPPDPALYADLLHSMYEFDKLKLTEEDRQKTRQYIEIRARESKKRTAKDLRSYLESLETRIEIRAAAKENLTRLHQLFIKTNQFNVTTIRYSLADAQHMLEDDDCILNVVTVADRFGTLGLVGVYVVRLADRQADLDSLVLSCRALGRGIETAICNQVKEQVFADERKSFLNARFVPTAKNKPAAAFFADQGFEMVSKDRDGVESYRLSRDASAAKECPGISINFEGTRK